MFLRIFFFGVFISFISSVVGISYGYFYYKLFDFSSYLPLWKIAALFTLISMILCGLFWLFLLIMKKKGILVFSMILTLLSITSVIFPTLYPPKFSDSVELPEFFPSFVLPLHFIVPLFWLTFTPHFLKENK
jgi:hypothetical protein